MEPGIVNNEVEVLLPHPRVPAYVIIPGCNPPCRCGETQKGEDPIFRSYEVPQLGAGQRRMAGGSGTGGCSSFHRALVVMSTRERSRVPASMTSGWGRAKRVAFGFFKWLLAGFEGGGNMICPSRCILRKATLQLISFKPPSGFLQFNSSQNIRESFWRLTPVAMRRPMRSISFSVNSRPQYLMGMSIPKKGIGVQNYVRGLQASAFSGVFVPQKGLELVRYERME